MFFETYVNFYQPTQRHILAACNLYNSRSKNFVARIGIDIVSLEGFLICSNVAEQISSNDQRPDERNYKISWAGPLILVSISIIDLGVNMRIGLFVHHCWLRA
jgi:hypothetical protein